MDVWLTIARWIDRLNEGIGRLSTGLVLILVGVGVWNVLARYLGQYIQQNLASNALIEIQWYLFALIFFLGAAYTLKHNGHVRVDIFYKNWDRRKQAIANLIGITCFLLPFCCLVLYFSWQTILQSWLIREMSPDPGGLPRYPIKSMVLVSFSLLILQGLSEGIKNFDRLKNHPPSPTDLRSEEENHGL
ncbi:TRAP transporter small permease subunit [Spirulina subsalsa]|uniref:TRAP transporter small permease subunit n=1 Tax=Spirulina subsalsa TaxID=54311 RepID=UPI00036D855D|nr:TRAP transporter small permease subunit [Spirulina subsalsa]